VKRLFLALLLAAGPACAAPASKPAATASAVAFDPTHAAFDALLARHVVGGRVAYAALAADRPALEAYIAGLAGPSAATVAAWPRDAQLAFWINAYNALTLRVVLDNQPLDSIKSIGLLPYAAFRAPVATFAARPAPLSLDTIEKGILLGELAEPRVHFAVSCASVGCPALLSRAWRGEDLDATLDASARAFLADPTKNQWDPATRTLRLSQIFEWYAADFERAAGSVPAYVARYAPPEMKAGIAAGDFTTEHIPYDWSLNTR